MSRAVLDPAPAGMPRSTSVPSASPTKAWAAPSSASPVPATRPCPLIADATLQLPPVEGAEVDEVAARVGPEGVLEAAAVVADAGDQAAVVDPEAPALPLRAGQRAEPLHHPPALDPERLHRRVADPRRGARRRAALVDRQPVAGAARVERPEVVDVVTEAPRRRRRRGQQRGRQRRQGRLERGSHRGLVSGSGAGEDGDDTSRALVTEPGPRPCASVSRHWIKSAAMSLDPLRGGSQGRN